MTIQAIISSVIAKARRRDDLWFAIVSESSDEMGLTGIFPPKSCYIQDQLVISILIHVVLQQFRLRREHHWAAVRS